MKKQILLFTLFVVSLSSWMRASTPLYFYHIGLTEGLSQSTIFDIAQDKRGFLWVATSAGLNRYDGYEFKVFRHSDSNQYSIGDDAIKNLFIDSTDQLWIGTATGLAHYNVDKGYFENYKAPKGGSIRHLCQYAKSKLIVNNNGGVYLFDTQSRKFIQKLHLPYTSCMYQAGHTVYIATVSGLYMLNTQTRKVWKSDFAKWQGRHIQDMFLHKNRLWIGTEGEGLYCIDLQNKQERHFTASNSPLCSNYVRSLSVDSDGQLWIGTVNGLNIVDIQDKWQYIGSNSFDEGSLSQNSVRCILRDNQKGMWVGTYFGGLNYYNPQKNRFTKIRHNRSIDANNHNITSFITQDSHQRLWLGTNGGIAIYDYQQHAFNYITTRDGLRSNDIKSIYIHPTNGNIYVGAQLGGLCIVTPITNKTQVYTTHTGNADDNSIYAITKGTNAHTLLLGTLTGLRHFNTLTHQFSEVRTATGGKLPQRKIRVIEQDGMNRLWTGAENGLIVYDAKEATLRENSIINQKHLLRHVAINSITLTDRQAWVGTQRGLYCVNIATGATKQYTVASGLPSNMVYGVVVDKRGSLWISTDNGLCCWNTKTHQFRNFTNADGISSNQFLPNAYYQSPTGDIYFGSVNGITKFNPQHFANNHYAPQPILTELRLFNTVVTPNDKTHILQTQIERTHAITLSPGQSMLAFKFSVPNFIAGAHNTFAYKLEGYESEWHQGNKSRIASYSNLPHGTYQLLVKVANNDGLWGKAKNMLEIEVLPHWYHTWWFRLLSLIVIALASIMIFRYLLERKKMEMQLAQERAEKRRISEVNEMKHKFFIDISHELRTPLTLITSPLQELQERTTAPWQQHQLQLIHTNTNRLLHLVNQLLDYRKAETGNFQLQVKPISPANLLTRLYEVFGKKAAKLGIDYQIDIENLPKETYCDPNFIDIIINNLLSNAFKHTTRGQKISLIGNVEDKYMVLSVADTGEGIAPEHQTKIFERFYQTDRDHAGTGIGLSLVKHLCTLHHGEITVESKQGEGSRFTVLLPYRAEDYQENEKVITTTQAQTAVSENAETIMIVEDNDDIREYIRSSLAPQYRILTAENGQEALSLLTTEQPQLIVTDVMMPLMDGLEFCKHVKQTIETCHIPVIILSAKTEQSEQLEGLKLGADDYMPKPFSMSILKSKIHNILRTRRLAIEHYKGKVNIQPQEIAVNPIDQDFLKSALEIVEKHLTDSDFSTERFAREMLMSRSNLHLKMKALIGESTNEFIKRVKFKKACELLRSRRYSISEIAYMTGFNTPSYFTASFKSRFNCLPSEYADRDVTATSDSADT